MKSPERMVTLLIMVAVLVLWIVAARAQDITVDVQYVWNGGAPEFDKFREFVLKLDRFNRKLGGCPEKGLDMTACSPASGYFDAGLWKNLRKDAREVFKLDA